MSNYIIYQCNVCRRTKDILRDNSRAIPNQCIITKGCAGSLLKIGETTNPSNTPTQAGLVDWYPRGQSIDITALTVPEQTMKLSCSSTGVVSLAIRTNAVYVRTNPSLTVKFIQRRIDDISFTLYQFKIISFATNIISGRDASGRILRFNQLAIDENRVFVRVNGVLSTLISDFTLAPDTISFTNDLPIGASIEISVYAAKDTISRELIFVANNSTSATVGSGSWGNIRWYTDDNEDQWWIYSCDSVSTIPTSARLKIETIAPANGQSLDFTDVRFMLASSPYENVDRYTNFYIDGVMIAQDFVLSTLLGTVNELYANYSSLVEVYPPIKLMYNTNMTHSSFVTADIFTASYAITVDTPAVRLSGTKIIGPA
jgi:hypothetical protein